jgi:hypothetical protein
MEVYSVIVEQVCNCEIIRLSTNVFSSMEKATQFFNRFVDDELKSYSNEKFIVERTKNTFEAYEEGNYSINHSCAVIKVNNIDDETIYC